MYSVSRYTPLQTRYKTWEDNTTGVLGGGAVCMRHKQCNIWSHTSQIQQLLFGIFDLKYW